MGVGSGDDEPSAARAIELRAEPTLPAVDPLDLIEEVGAVGAVFTLEGFDHEVERGVIERRGEPGILEIDEQAAAAVERIAVDELPEERRFSAAAHPLDDQGNVGPKRGGEHD